MTCNYVYIYIMPFHLASQPSWQSWAEILPQLEDPGMVLVKVQYLEAAPST